MPKLTRTMAKNSVSEDAFVSALWVNAPRPWVAMHAHGANAVGAPPSPHAATSMARTWSAMWRFLFKRGMAQSYFTPVTFATHHDTDASILHP